MSYGSSGLVFKIKWSIEEKLAKVKALTLEKAVTADEAGLSFSESNWLLYLAGGMTSNIRKTAGGRYYLRGTSDLSRSTEKEM